MKYKLEFQYKSEDSERPEDCVQDEQFISENGEYFPIPDVGDSVAYKYGEKMKAFKVLTRDFSYIDDLCCINIVVTDISEEELSSRLKM
jgi:hypothetical protein